MAACKTVGQLIERLKEFDENAELDIDISWYDRNNYNHAHRDIWLYQHNGIHLFAAELEKGIVTIANDDPRDIDVYK